MRLLTLDRPDRRNALSPALVAALLDALRSAFDDSAVGAVVLTGRGAHFCAGGDLGPGGLADGGFLAQHHARGLFVDLLLALHRAPVPVVAAMQGDALGGGAGLVAACQLVVMGADARLSTPELRLGLFPWMIAPMLARKLPRNLLNELIFCGRKLTATDAVAVGFAAASAPTADVVDVALALAQKAASSSPAVRRLGLQALATTEDLPLEPALRHMHGQLALNLMTEDAAEGIAAFLGRRPPEWKGR